MLEKPRVEDNSHVAALKELFDQGEEEEEEEQVQTDEGFPFLSNMEDEEVPASKKQKCEEVAASTDNNSSM